jgi:Protein of unknown function (DUF1565)
MFEVCGGAFTQVQKEIRMTSQHRRAVYVCAVVFAVFSGLAQGQANINEGQETAFVYVDGTKGSDTNPGTQAKPFKTIGHAAVVAMANNHKSIGTRVTINPGTYRESILLPSSSSDTSLPITFEAAEAGTVTVSGSNVWTGWQPYAGKAGAYTNSWPYTWGLCPPSSTGPFLQNINLRREMIFVNGTPLTQVLTLSQLGVGTFFVDETNAIVYINPASKTNISTATIEVATQSSPLAAYQKSNIVLRGLNFTEANSCRDSAAVSFFGGSNILIDTDTFNWNNSVGLDLNITTNFTVQNSLANHNGQEGFNTFEAKNGLWTANEADYSNWRGAQGGIYGWSAGGFHFFAQHDNTVNGAKMFYNMSHGVHWDTDDVNDTAESIISAYNLRNGVVVEASEGPVSISNSYVCFNAPLLLYYDGGMALRGSTYVTLTGNTFANNLISEIPITGIQGGVPIPITNYETGQKYNLLTTNLTLTSNTIAGGANEQLFLDFDQAGSAWTDFLSTLDSNHNDWWNGSVAKPFTVPEPSYDTPISWAQWLSTTDQDKNSTFSAPSGNPTAPCQVSPDGPDLWFVNQNTGALTVTAGSPAVYTMLLIPIGGFVSKTTFSSYGVGFVPGAKASWSKASVTGAGTVTFTVTTSNSTPSGTYPITMAAHAGSIERTVTVSLTVQ